MNTQTNAPNITAPERFEVSSPTQATLFYPGIAEAKARAIALLPEPVLIFDHAEGVAIFGSLTEPTE